MQDSEEQTDAVMQEDSDTRDMVAGWWKYQRLASGGRAERKALELGEPSDAVAAADAVDERVRLGGAQALMLMSALLHGAVTDDDLALLGAGPIEDLLLRHGTALVDEVDDLARRDPRFARAITAVCWSAADAGPEVTRRLRRWIPALQR
jgi:hypothetical protein